MKRKATTAASQAAAPAKKQKISCNASAPTKATSNKNLSATKNGSAKAAVNKNPPAAASSTNVKKRKAEGESPATATSSKKTRIAAATGAFIKSGKAAQKTPKSTPPTSKTTPPRKNTPTIYTYSPGASTGLFSKLPGEITEKILKHIILTPSNEPIALVNDPKTDKKKPTHIEPPILRTCKEIRSIYSPVYYGQNNFLTDSIETANRFLKRLADPITNLRALQAGALKISDPYDNRRVLLETISEEEKSKLPKLTEEERAPRTLRQIRRTLMAMKYAVGRKGLEMDRVEMRMEVGVQGSVGWGTEWKWVSVEDVVGHQYESKVVQQRRHTVVKAPQVVGGAGADAEEGEEEGEEEE